MCLERSDTGAILAPLVRVAILNCVTIMRIRNARCSASSRGSSEGKARVLASLKLQRHREEFRELGSMAR